MQKYNVSLKVRFEVEGPDLATAIQGVIYTHTDTFENVHGLELTNIWEFKDKDCVADSEVQVERKA